tara:strand:+ start:538 stop:948 length:411 start_codon:yes stop_codon:yes gene_type:complete
MNPAFERHAAYLDQAWRTLQDSVLLKILRGQSLENHRNAGCTGCRLCSDQHQHIRDPQIPKVVEEQPKEKPKRAKGDPQLVGDWVNYTPEQHERQQRLLQMALDLEAKERANRIARQTLASNEIEDVANENQFQFG